jgi:uncharacterized protein (DUF2062 family)
MKGVARRLYNEPVLFLGAVQLAVSGAAAEGVISGWIPVVTLTVIAFLQRQFVRPRRRR